MPGRLALHCSLVSRLQSAAVQFSARTLPEAARQLARSWNRLSRTPWNCDPGLAARIAPAYRRLWLARPRHSDSYGATLRLFQLSPTVSRTAWPGAAREYAPARGTAALRLEVSAESPPRHFQKRSPPAHRFCAAGRLWFGIASRCPQPSNWQCRFANRPNAKGVGKMHALPDCVHE